MKTHSVKPTFLLRGLSLALLFGVVTSAPVRDARGAPEPKPDEKTEPRDISAMLREPRTAHGVPGMAAAVVRGGRVTAIGADGLRVAGGKVPVTTADLWHLGSCTKSMTATLCARLVEDGKLSWDRTLAKTFPERVDKMAPGWKDITLEMLLTNRAGVPTDLSRDGLWERLWKFTGSGTDARLALLDGVVAHPPESKPGSTFLYSNAGFSIAGAMAERATGKSWEELIQERLFQPLSIKTAGFGPPGNLKEVDQPRGHRHDGTPVEPGPGADNPVAIAPAGLVHMSIGDWAKYVALHLEAARGKPRLLEASSFQRLHDPPKGFDYAMGWARGERDWAGRRAGVAGPILMHAGSNNMWYCVVWIAPDRDLAILVCCNRGGPEAEKACDAVSSALVGEALK